MNKEYPKALSGNPHLIDSGFDSPPKNPFVLLKSWFEQVETLNILEARAMTLSTVNTKNQPSSRMVLITSIDGGIYFGTREDSQKGIDIKNNPLCAGNIFWRETVQQINFQGKVVQLSDDISDQEFSKRIPEAQAITVCSVPGVPMQNELAVKNAVKALLAQNKPIERPLQWHLYRIDLTVIEFWVGSEDRFYKRLRYDLTDESWKNQRLQP